MTAAAPDPVRAKTFQFGVFEVDLVTRELFRSGRKVALQEQPFHVLEMLLERPGELVTREDLQQRIWSSTAFGDFDLGLNKAVAKLREALHDDASAPRYIETLPRRGYRFIGGTVPVVPAPEVKKSNRAWLLVLAAAIVLAAGAAFLLRQRWSGTRSVVAVLPFRSLTPDPKQDYLSDALTVELITTLSRAHPSQLGVIAPTSVMPYRNSTQGVRAIGEQLHAQYIVEGTVQRADHWVRVNARLTRVDDQTQVWADVFDRQDGDVFQVQSDVANAIARAVRVRIAPQRVVVHPTSNPEAYDAYLKGVYLEQSKADASAAVMAFEQAVKLDPNFAAAWVGIAESSMFLQPRAEVIPRAEAAVRRAIALDPNLAVAHAANGTLQMIWHWNWTAADAEFRRAMSVAPVEPGTLMRYAQYLAARGRLDEAIVTQRRAADLDPRSPLILQQLGRFYYFNHQPENAIYEWNKSLQIDPTFWWSHVFLSFVYRDRGDMQQWYEHQKRAWEIGNVPKPILAAFELSAKTKGYEDTWRTMVRFHEASAAKMESLTLAIENAKLGDRNRALDWLESTIDRHPNDAIYINVEPAFDPLRNEPRFQAVVKRVGL